MLFLEGVWDDTTSYDSWVMVTGSLSSNRIYDCWRIFWPLGGYERLYLEYTRLTQFIQYQQTICTAWSCLYRWPLYLEWNSMQQIFAESSNLVVIFDSTHPHSLTLTLWLIYEGFYSLPRTKRSNKHIGNTLDVVVYPKQRDPIFIYLCNCVMSVAGICIRALVWM